METTANGTTAAKVNGNENKNSVNNIATPAGEYGDLCYDYFGKSSVIVFGNTDDHAAQLEAIGGKYSERLKYSPLQNGRKWAEKQGRTAGYYFTTERAKREAIRYVQRVNHAIFDRYEQSTEGGEHLRQKPADFKEGDRVRTIHGLGTVTANEPKYNKAVSVCVRLDKMTYNYAWKGMPHTFIECRCDEITHYTPSEKSEAAHERKTQEWQEFLDREAEKQNSFAEGMRVTVPAASLTDGEAFVIVTIRCKAADNGGNASLTVKNETTGDVRNINGSDVRDILPPLEPASEITEAEKRDTLCRLWDEAWQQAQADQNGTRVIVETNEEDPSANCNPYGRYYMVDGSESESCIEHAGQWVVIRVDTVTSPYEVHRPNFAAAHGYSDDQTQLACRCENPNNVTRWARKMIDAGRVTDIYADCY